jgi:hypothetical protein
MAKDLGPEVLQARGRDSVGSGVVAGATQSDPTRSWPDSAGWISTPPARPRIRRGRDAHDATVAPAARGVNDALETTAADRFAMVFLFTHVGGIQSLFGFLDVGSGSI